ncbi:hypothetical protein QE152_g13163 [Popillia japonica]|uniref:Uncharacterized protein n=1 Tax=Popillia japonica TaxID=7064 RepID=A0AAW1LF67_POPJA
MTTLTRIIFLLLPILIDCQMTAPQQKCLNITCPNHSSDEAACELGHIEDPFTNKCVAQCDGPCSNGHCNFCYCSFPTEEDIESAQLAECKRNVLVKCSSTKCIFHVIKACTGNYTYNPYNHYECVPRCDEDSCGDGGTCSPAGHCVCYLGYRPDVTNPRIFSYSSYF